jgi:hypothetical protein
MANVQNRPKPNPAPMVSSGPTSMTGGVDFAHPESMVVTPKPKK